MTKSERGRLEPVNDSLNKLKGIANLDYRVWLGGLFCSILVFLVGAVVSSLGFLKMGSPLLFIALIAGAKYVTKDDPRMLALMWLAVKQSAYYDAGKRG
jgi:hypothetical protein